MNTTHPTANAVTHGYETLSLKLKLKISYPNPNHKRTRPWKRSSKLHHIAGSEPTPRDDQEEKQPYLKLRCGSSCCSKWALQGGTHNGTGTQRGKKRLAHCHTEVKPQDVGDDSRNSATEAESGMWRGGREHIKAGAIGWRGMRKGHRRMRGKGGEPGFEGQVWWRSSHDDRAEVRAAWTMQSSGPSGECRRGANGLTPEACAYSESDVDGQTWCVTLGTWTSMPPPGRSTWARHGGCCSPSRAAFRWRAIWPLSHPPSTYSPPSLLVHMFSYCMYIRDFSGNSGVHAAVGLGDSFPHLYL